MNTDQIAAEAWDEIYNANANRPQGISIIKAAIEKATVDWKAANDILRAENRGLFAKAEALEEANKKFEVVILEGEEAVNTALRDELKQLRVAHASEQVTELFCPRCDQRLSQRPTPSTASETQKVVNGPVWSAMMEEQERKPESASAGKYKHEYADHLPATDATDHAATPSGGGEWTVMDVVRLLAFEKRDGKGWQRVADAHNAALRDCGNDTALVREIAQESALEFNGVNYCRIQITPETWRKLIRRAAILETGEQTKEKE